MTEVASPTITRDTSGVRVKGRCYTWTWTEADDRFVLDDSAGRTIADAPLQPLVQTSQGCSPGQVDAVQVDTDQITVRYSDVNGAGGAVGVTCRFDSQGFWIEPVVYTGHPNDDVVSLHYFSDLGADAVPRPALRSGYVVQPGVSGASVLGPVLPAVARIEIDAWLGHGCTQDRSRVAQQWGLPSHFFCGMSVQGHPNFRSAMSKQLSDAFCCGLADLPAGDVRFRMSDGYSGLVVDILSNLWGQARGRGPWTLGATLRWSLGADYRDAIRSYYRDLVAAGIVDVKRHSALKNDVLRAAKFNTWGQQLVMQRYSEHFDQESLEAIYADVHRAGMRPGCFVIDDKWEGAYGLLEHDPKRFPDFLRFLDRVRSDGLRVGLWAAFLRCDDPATLGLSVSDMLRDPQGQPIRTVCGSASFYLFDVTVPAVAGVLRERARAFARRYRPDLVKFDFGYELPTMAQGAPADLEYAGERLLARCLEVVVDALREVNPDIAVMYYCLSPLFTDYLDAHSTDDPWMANGEYPLEMNRRLYFASVLGEVGISAYGSSGYDWIDTGEIWFDSVAAGSLGSLGSFAGDQRDTEPDPADIARYNGLSALSRSANVFTVEPLTAPRLGGSSAARSDSWVRLEDGEPVLVALRANRGSEAYGSMVTTDAQVVVGSLSDSGIATTRLLGVVPFRDGEVVIRHDGGAHAAAVRTHGPGGALSEESVAIRDGQIRLRLRTEVDGVLVEWLRIELTDGNPCGHRGSPRGPAAVDGQAGSSDE